MANAKIDQNYRRSLLAVLDDGSLTTEPVRANPITKRLLVSAVVTSNNTGIGNTIPGGTPGSVLFLDIGSTLAEDNSHFFYDPSIQSLAIGHNNPQANLHVIGTVRFDLGSDATGDIYYRNSTGDLTRLPIGTSGQLLTVTGGLPTWSTSSISSGYDTIQDNGSPLIQRNILNFVNYFDVLDSSGKTNVSINTSQLGADSTLISTLESNLDLANISGQIDLSTQVTGLLLSTNIDITDLESNLDLANISGQIDLTTQVTGLLPASNIDVVGLANDSTFLSNLIPNLDENVQVAVDGVTITGDGTTANPLVATGNADFTKNFTYGETLSVNDYVFQANGNESINIDGTGSVGVYTTIASNTTFLSQGFSISDARMSKIKSIGFTSYWANFSGVSGNFVAKVYATSGGSVPTGTLLGTSDPLPASSTYFGININGTFTFNFSTPVSISSGNDYCVVIDSSGVTFSGRTMNLPQFNTVSPFQDYALSSNSGASYTTITGKQISIFVETGLTTGSVYKVDITTPIYNMGPYKGTVAQAGVAGNSKKIQLQGTVSGFTSLTTATNLYIDSSTPGQLVQTPGGRAVAIAISSTEIQLISTKTRGSGQSYTAGTIINQDGFLIGTVSVFGSNTYQVIETNNGAQTTLINLTSGLSGSSVTLPVTIPVKAGCSYNVSGNFYPSING